LPAIRSATLRVETPRGPVTAQAGDRRADIILPDRTPRPGQIVAVYDRNTGLFWWRYESLNPAYPTGIVERLRNTSTFYQANDKLISFSMLAASLVVRQSTERAKNLPDALDKAVALVTIRQREIEVGTVQWATLVDLSTLGNDF